MEVIDLVRVATSDLGTFGVLVRGGIPLCVTCEDPWKDNRRNISCVPTGTYTCRRYSSKRFPDVWEVFPVPGRSLILIHNGNTIDHTEGCILVGKAFGMLKGLPMVTESVPTLDRLRKALPSEFTLRVTNPQ